MNKMCRILLVSLLSIYFIALWNGGNENRRIAQAQDFYDQIPPEIRKQRDQLEVELRGAIERLQRLNSQSITDLGRMESFELEEEITRMGRDINSGNRKLLILTNMYGHPDKKLEDFRKVNKAYEDIKKIKKKCDEGDCPSDPFAIEGFDHTPFINRTVEDRAVVLSNGYKFKDYANLESYILRMQSQMPQIEADKKKMDTERTALEGYIRVLEQKYRDYAHENDTRKAYSALTGYWKFQTNKTTIMITGKRDKESVYYFGIVTVDGIKRFKNGDVLFLIVQPAEDGHLQKFDKGVEFECGKSEYQATGVNPRKQRIHLAIEGNRLIYTPAGRGSAPYYLNKIGPLQMQFQGFAFEESAPEEFTPEVRSILGF